MAVTMISLFLDPQGPPDGRHLLRALILVGMMIIGWLVSSRFRKSEPWKTGKWLLLVVVIVVIAVFIFLAASSH